MHRSLQLTFSLVYVDSTLTDNDDYDGVDAPLKSSSKQGRGHPKSKYLLSMHVQLAP